jgi:hypothetical protein
VKRLIASRWAQKLGTVAGREKRVMMPASLGKNWGWPPEGASCVAVGSTVMSRSVVEVGLVAWSGQVH